MYEVCTERRKVGRQKIEPVTPMSAQIEGPKSCSEVECADEFQLQELDLMCPCTGSLRISPQSQHCVVQIS